MQSKILFICSGDSDASSRIGIAQLNSSSASPFKNIKIPMKRDLNVAEKPSVAQSITGILSRGRFQQVKYGGLQRNKSIKKTKKQEKHKKQQTFQSFHNTTQFVTLKSWQ